MRTTTYLSQPYSHIDPQVRNDRAEIGAVAAAWLMQRGWAVHAPIPMGCAVASHLPSILAHDHAFWMAQDLPIMRSCDYIHILPLEGWRTSRGLAEELAEACAAHKRVRIIQHLPTFDHRLEVILPAELFMAGWEVEA